jgi:hypothetical protein
MLFTLHRTLCTGPYYKDARGRDRGSNMCYFFAMRFVIFGKVPTNPCT